MQTDNFARKKRLKISYVFSKRIIEVRCNKDWYEVTFTTVALRNVSLSRSFMIWLFLVFIIISSASFKYNFSLGIKEKKRAIELIQMKVKRTTNPEIEAGKNCSNQCGVSCKTEVNQDLEEIKVLKEKNADEKS